MIRRFPLVALTLAVLALAPSTAIAGKTPGTAPPSSIALNQPDPHLGDYVTFTVTYPKAVKYPRIGVRCYDATGNMAYAQAGAYADAFLLGGGASAWLTAGGPADCTGELFYFTSNGSTGQQYYSLAWTSFHAGG